MASGPADIRAAIPAEARLEIAELGARFAVAVDHHAYDDLREVFSPEARYVSTNGTETVGVDRIVAWFSSRVRPRAERVTRHGLSNLLITAFDGDTAAAISTWHTFAANAPIPAAVPVFQVADFADRYERRDGRWWIVERVTRPVFRDPSLAPDAH